MRFLINLFKFIVVILFCVSGRVFAWSCSTPQPQVMTLSGDVIVQRDALPGTVIMGWVRQDWPSYTGCSTDVNKDFNTGIDIAAAKAPTGQTVQIGGMTFPVYATNIQGIGYIIESRDSLDGNEWSGWVAQPSSTNFSLLGLWGTQFPDTEVGLGMSIALVTYGTGTVGEGGITIGNVASARACTENTYCGGSATISVSSSVVVTKVACSMNSGFSLAFSMGQITADQFTGINSVSSETKTENLELNCDKGTNVNVTLSGVQNPDSTDTSILALSPTSNTAQGIGVQLLYNNVPIKLNSLLNIDTAAPEGMRTYPITARYIQTKDKVTPGSANTTATLNVIYQ